jgi:ribosomal protein L13
LNGEEVIIINAEKAIISGKKKAKWQKLKNS